MRPATWKDLEELAVSRRTGQNTLIDWTVLGQTLGRTWTLLEDEDYKWGREEAIRRSAYMWARSRGLTVNTRVDKLHGRILVTFHPPKFKRSTKWDAAIASGAWVQCAYHERGRALGYAERMNRAVEFKYKKARFVKPAPSGEAESTP